MPAGINSETVYQRQSGEWRHHAMLTHNGELMAVALDDQRRFHYVVLDAKKASEGDDARGWPTEPKPLHFPNELAVEGMAALPVDRLPDVRADGAESDPGSLDVAERDGFMSTTARLTADAPFKLMSDGQYVYLFRQTVAPEEPGALYRTSGGLTGDPEGGSPIDRTLLVDRFLLVDGSLQAVREVRFRRSRNASVPESRTDVLGVEDMDGNAFTEPTRELAFIGPIEAGRFAVLLLPTGVSDVQRWQVFAQNARSHRLDSWNVARADNGWFDTRGDELWTCVYEGDPPERPSHGGAVLERKPGPCPMDDSHELVPVSHRVDRGETAVGLSSADTLIRLPVLETMGIDGDLTVELWLKPSRLPKRSAPILRLEAASGGTTPLLSLSAGVLAVGDSGKSTRTIEQDEWSHIALVWGHDGDAILYLNGARAYTGTSSGGLNGALLVGGGDKKAALEATVDALRVWSGQRQDGDVRADLSYRLRGDEPMLSACYRFDEGASSVAFDVTGNGHDARIEGGAAWLADAAPIGNRPGVDRNFVALTDRPLAGGMDALLYYQQEARRSGHDGESRPAAQNARVMLALGTAGPELHTAPPVTDGLVLHLEADSYASGDSWNDLSGRGHHARLADNAQWPSTISVNTGDGVVFPAVRFSATDGLDVADALRLSGAHTAMIIDRFWGEQRGRSFQGRDANWLLGKHGIEGGVDGFHAGNWVGREPAHSDAFRLNAATLDPNGGDHASTWFLDGVERHHAADPAPPGRLSLGRAGKHVEPADVDIAAVLVWDRVLSRRERQDVEQWLGRRFGILQAQIPQPPVSDGLVLNLQGEGLEAGRWRDGSGEGHDATPVGRPPQKLHIQRPGETASAAVARFEPAGGMAVSGHLALGDTCTVMVVDRFWGEQKGRTLQGRTRNWVLGRHREKMMAYASNESYQSVEDDGPRHLRVSAVAVDGGHARVRFNGDQAATLEGFTGPGTLAINKGGLYDGEEHGGTRHADHTSECEVAAVLAWDRALTDDELGQVEAWLTERFPLNQDVVDAETQDHIAVVDFGVARDGTLTRLPSRLALPAIHAAGSTQEERDELLDRLMGAQDQVTELRAGVEHAESEQRRLASKVRTPRSVGSDVEAEEARLRELKDRGATFWTDTSYSGDKQKVVADAEVSNVEATHGDLTTTTRFLDFALKQSSISSVEVDSGIEVKLFDLPDYQNGQQEGRTRKVKKEVSFGVFGSSDWMAKDETDSYQIWVAYATHSATSSLPDLGQHGLDDRVSSFKVRRTEALKAEIEDAADRIELAKANRTLEPLRTKLKAAEGELAGLADVELGVQVPLRMPLVHLDARGLAASGAILGFAWGPSAPILARSALGRVALYFRGADEQLYTAAYDAHTGRSVLRHPTKDGNLTFIARSAEPEFDATTVSVGDASSGQPDRCDVRIGNERLDLWEEWPNLPRNAGRLTEILSGGSRVERKLVGRLAKESKGRVASFQLQTAAEIEADAGERIELAGRTLWLSKAVTSKHKKVEVDAVEGLDVPENAPVYLLRRYDLGSVRSNTTAPLFSAGSRLLRPLPGASGEVQTGDAEVGPASPSSTWQPDAPGGAVAFTGREWLTGHLREGRDEQTERPDWAAPADVTVEAWIEPWKDLDHDASVIHVAPGTVGYHLGLVNVGNDLHVRAACRLGAVRSKQPVASGEWHHVAAVYRHSMALQFDGAAALDAGDGDHLDLCGDLTIELGVVWTGNAGDLVRMGDRTHGGDAGMPYALSVDENGTLTFEFEDADGDLQTFTATKQLKVNMFHRVAVTRRGGHERHEKKETKSFGGQDVEVVADVTVADFHDIAFFVDDRSAGGKKYEGSLPQGKAGSLAIGTGLQGTMSEVRLWAKAVDGKLYRRLQGNEDGLVGWWRFEDGHGRTADDSRGGSHARIKGANWVDNPDPDGSTLRLLVDGAPIEVETCDAPDPDWGDRQVTVGGRLADGTLADAFVGQLEELRVWKAARTDEQIQDNLFGRLRGERSLLRAGFTFDDLERKAGEWLDHGPFGLSLSPGDPVDAPRRVVSTAPVAKDAPEIRAALAGVKTKFHRAGSSATASAEYGDLQRQADGSLRGALKRAHAWLDGGRWVLRTGFKVGELEQEWVGQAQFDPQVIGFVEGSPPVPSENMTDGAIVDDIMAVSSVTFEESEEVVYSLSSSRERGFSTSFEAKASLGTSFDTVIAPFGVGISLKGKVTASLGAQMEGSNTWTDGETIGAGANRTTSLTVGIAGGWEDRANRLNDALTARFAPANQGMVLVRSETADVFALRIAHTGALVQYRMLPNLDIPPDVNLIPFPINPLYTKQGTLDGKVGMDADGQWVLDHDYRNATAKGEYSYHKPREAYALRRRIEREEQALHALYADSDTTPAGVVGTAIGAGVGALAVAAGGAAAAPIMGAAATVGGLIGALASDRDLPKKMASRNNANTYVWTADGGFLELSTQRSESRSETFGGDYSFAGSATVGMEVEIEAPITAGLEMSSSLGGSLHLNRTRSSEAHSTFGLTVVANPQGDLQMYQYDKDGNPLPQFDDAGNPVNQHGKVDCYRFTTFYLEPEKRNTEDLFSKVIDPLWLQRDHPNARALRQANQPGRMPPSWRVFHRVTFVSRILPEIPPPGTPTHERKAAGIGLSSNWEMIRALAPYVQRGTTDRMSLEAQVRTAVEAHFPELATHVPEVGDVMAAFLGIAD